MKASTFDTCSVLCCCLSSNKQKKVCLSLLLHSRVCFYLKSSICCSNTLSSEQYLFGFVMRQFSNTFILQCKKSNHETCSSLRGPASMFVFLPQTESGQPICGNGLVEPGEECDCGYSDQCRDQCCYDANQPDNKKCKLKPNKVCR